jgi:hypothetical protein
VFGAINSDFTAAYAQFAIASAAMLVKRRPLPLEGAHGMMCPQCALAGAHNRNPTEAGDEEPPAHMQSVTMTLMQKHAGSSLET